MEIEYFPARANEREKGKAVEKSNKFPLYHFSIQPVYPFICHCICCTCTSLILLIFHRRPPFLHTHTERAKVSE